MSSFLSELGGITKGVGAEGLAFAAGFAAAHALEPEAVTILQDAWHGAPVRRIDPATAAEVAAESYASYDDMAAEASYNGWDSSRFAYLYRVTLTAPGAGELLSMLRRGTISRSNFAHGLRKAKLEPMWDDALADLRHQYIGLGDIALAIVRGVVPTPSWVPVGPPTSGTTIPRYPIVDIDPAALAAKLGYDENMLRIMTARSGLSLAPGLAAQAYFRSIITRADAHLAAAEGDLRTEWTDTLIDVSRQILTAGEYVEAALRGWTSDAEMYAGTAKHGMTQTDTDLLFKIQGRPIAVHQITTGLARGGTYPSTYDDVPEPYRKAIQESNIRPEWASLDYHNRYTYPSAFVLRSLAQSGEIGGEAAVEQVLLEIGWKPSFAAKIAAAWTAGNAAGDPHVGKAQTQLWGTTHRSYVAEEIDNATATTAIEAAGVPAATAPAVLALWGHERALVRKQLSPAQIKKAVHEAVTNPATGQPWTQADALAALMARGYDQADATTLLEL